MTVDGSQSDDTVPAGAVESLDRETLRVLAERILKISRALDYGLLCRHDPAEYARLNKFLEALNGNLADAVWDTLLNYAAPQPAPRERRSETEEHNAALAERQAQRREAVAAKLAAAEFGDRVGQLYSTADSRRRIAMDEMPHRRGLPPFDTVLVPDFSPVAGYHGIFVTPIEVLSAVLPEPGDGAQWRIRQRKPYQNEEELVEYITLMAAGFEV